MRWFQALQHLAAGVPLEHGETHLRPGEAGGAPFALTRLGRTTTHDDIGDAIDAFAHDVGPAGLRQAIAGSRYRVLFPAGSSLEWPHRALTAWRRPRRWDAPNAAPGTEPGAAASRAGRVVGELHAEAPHPAGRAP